MTDIYTLPTVNDTLGLDSFAIWANQTSGFLMFPLILFGLYIIILVATQPLGYGRSFIFASFFCSILSIILVVGGLLNPIYMYFLFVMLAASLLLTRLGKSSSLPQI